MKEIIVKTDKAYHATTSARYFIEKDKRTIGDIIVTNSNGSANIEILDVDHKYEKSGHGTALLLLAAYWAQRESITQFIGTALDIPEQDFADLITWYADRGILVDSENRSFIGNVLNVIDLCETKLKKHKTRVKLNDKF